MKIKILITLIYFVLLVVVGHTHGSLDIRIIDTVHTYLRRNGNQNFNFDDNICDFIKLPENNTYDIVTMGISMYIVTVKMDKDNSEVLNHTIKKFVMFPSMHVKARECLSSVIRDREEFYTCSKNKLRCNDWSCILKSWTCQHGTGEQNYSNQPCSENEFTCGNHRCLPMSQVCDGINDCKDHSDETHESCPKINTCPFPLRCKRPKICVKPFWSCDGNHYCGDKLWDDDPLYCRESNCSTNNFRCKNRRCIPATWYCDGHDDCFDNSDEDPSDCAKRTCPWAPSSFRCPNHRCIPANWYCDGDDDCGDGADEPLEYYNIDEDTTHRCSDRKCDEKSQFTCKANKVWNKPKCIPRHLVCNGAADCVDGADENTTLNDCSIPETCSDGYKLVAGETPCMDIDECIETPEVCSQICINTPGFYECKCDETFYEKSLHSPTCKRRDDETAWLLLTDKHYLLNHSIESQEYGIIHQGLLSLVALDYDLVDNKLYFSDVTAKRIYRSDYDVSDKEKETVMENDANGVEGLSVDWIAKKLYWLDQVSQTLEVSELNGTNRKTLKSGIKDPKALALHPGIGYVFFTSFYLQVYIGKIGMDGSNMSRILTWKDNIAWPSALTIDYFANRLYWADAHYDYIAFCDYEGHHRHTVISGDKVPHIFALSIFDDYVFWSDWNLKAIMRANKLNGSDVITLRNTTHQPYDLLVYHKLRQLSYGNPCRENNGGCSHLCLIAPKIDPVLEDESTSYKCACPNRFKLSSDNRTCDAPYEVCPCKNDGKCVRNSSTLTCQCEPKFSGDFCDVFVSKNRISNILFQPIVVIWFMLAFVAIWLHVRSKKFGKLVIKSDLSNAKQVISSLQGSNPSKQSNNKFRMDKSVSQRRDFTNPIYETMDIPSINYKNNIDKAFGLKLVNDYKETEQSHAVTALSNT